MSLETVPIEITDNLHRLIRSISPEIDTENLKRCVDFATYHVCCGKYSIPSESETKKLLETFSTKYDYFGFPNYSKELSACVHNYSKPDPSDKRDKVEVKWRILEFLTKLSKDAFSTDNLFSLEDKLEASKKVIYPEEITEEECINWYQYLREGHEKFQLPSDEESDDDISLEFSSVREASPITKPTPLYCDLFAKFDGKKNTVDDERTTFMNALKDSEISKKWFGEHTQHSWWYESRPYESCCKYPSSEFGVNWDKSQNTIYSSSGIITKCQYLVEYKAIRQLFWILLTNDQKQRISKEIHSVKTQISVPSLIQETFSSFISDLIDVAVKYHELRSFTDDVFDDVLQMPFTFQAYGSVLRNIFQPFVHKIVELEHIILKQDDINTLLSIRHELDPYLQQINFLHHVHSTSLDADWRAKPAWEVAIKLLSSIHSRFELTTRQAETRILLLIFFKTFKSYADIIDHWLTEGKLDDWKNEFFIQRLEHGTCIVLPRAPCNQTRSIPVSDFLYRMADRLITCSKNVDFLCKLNKTSQLKEQLKKGKLINVFVTEFVRQFHQHDSSPRHEPFRNDRTAFETHSCVEFFSMESLNPYLVRGFEQNLAEIYSSTTSQRCAFEGLNSLPDLEVYSIGLKLEAALNVVIDRRESIIVDLFQSSLIQDYRLFDHIRTLSDLLLMDLHGFCNKLNIRLEKRIWEGDHLLKVFLLDAVESNKLAFGHSLHFVLDQKDQYTENFDVCVSEIIKVVDCVHLHYMVQWPMNMIFDNNVVENFYEKLFKLVLKVNIAFSSVTRLYYKDLPLTKFFALRLRRMQMFRYWVLQLLYRLRSYLSLIISQCLDCNIIEKNLQINTFTTLHSHYIEYLESCKKQCLINTEISATLESAFNKVWLICDHVRELWSKSMKLTLTDKDVSKAVELYVQCLWYLTQILEKHAKRGKRENNPLYNLWSELSHMVEVHRSTIPEDLPFTGISDE